MVLTELARRLRGFDESFAIVADWDFYLRVSQQGLLATVERPLVAYFVHTDSMVHDAVRYLGEIDRLAAKYQDEPDVGLEIDRGDWLADLAWMALGAGQYATTVRFLLGALRNGAARKVLRGLTVRVRRRLARASIADSTLAEPIEWLGCDGIPH